MRGNFKVQCLVRGRRSSYYSWAAAMASMSTGRAIGVEGSDLAGSPHFHLGSRNACLLAARILLASLHLAASVADENSTIIVPASYCCCSTSPNSDYNPSSITDKSCCFADGPYHHMTTDAINFLPVVTWLDTDTAPMTDACHHIHHHCRDDRSSRDFLRLRSRC